MNEEMKKFFAEFSVFDKDIMKIFYAENIEDAKNILIKRFGDVCKISDLHEIIKKESE